MALGSQAAAHRAAEAIVAQGRFHQPPVPDPLHGVVEWVGNAVTDPFNAIGRLVSHLGRVFPGGVAGVWAVGAALLLVAVWMLLVRRARFQLGQALEELTGGVRPETPAALEREAALAERAQRWDDAVRLRFRAGILRLGERLELPSTETVPNHTIGRLLRSRRFDSLAGRFDEVAYGGDVATEADAEQQRSEWPQLLGEAGGR
ncbi:MAG TPA: hypothetical protein VG293_08030 [Solirubrobacteraceae bacterium]|jgi:hypothetical protein|nr:hypothetical protein [Solirubrobacteraceae bacterium]